MTAKPHTKTYNGIRQDATLYLSFNDEQLIYGQKLTGESKFTVQKITAYQYGKEQIQKEAQMLLQSANWVLTSYDGKMVLNGVA